MLPEYRSFLIRGEDGQEYGPVGLEELRDWVQENRAGLGTEVRLDEPGTTWQPWQNYPDLVALLAHVHVTSPVPGQPGLVIAPMGRRVAAFGLDLVLVTIPTLIICSVLILTCFPSWMVQEKAAFDRFVQDVEAGNQHPFSQPDPPPNAWTLNLVRFLTLALYFAGFPAAHGKTPAQALFRLRVVDATGHKPTLAKSMVRASMLIFSMVLFYIPLVYTFFHPQRRALHDLAAGTYVIKA